MYHRRKEEGGRREEGVGKTGRIEEGKRGKNGEGKRGKGNGNCRTVQCMYSVWDSNGPGLSIRLCEVGGGGLLEMY